MSSISSTGIMTGARSKSREPQGNQGEKLGKEHPSVMQRKTNQLKAKEFPSQTLLLTLFIAIQIVDATAFPLLALCLDLSAIFSKNTIIILWFTDAFCFKLWSFMIMIVYLYLIINNHHFNIYKFEFKNLSFRNFGIGNKFNYNVLKLKTSLSFLLDLPWSRNKIFFVN